MILFFSKTKNKINGGKIMMFLFFVFKRCHLQKANHSHRKLLINAPHPPPSSPFLPLLQLSSLVGHFGAVDWQWVHLQWLGLICWSGVRPFITESSVNNTISVTAPDGEERWATPEAHGCVWVCDCLCVLYYLRGRGGNLMRVRLLLRFERSLIPV